MIDHTSIFDLLSKFLGWLLDRLPGKKTNDPSIPNQTLRLVLQPRGAWWHMGLSKDKSAMQVVSQWYATNITTEQVIITNGFIRKPKTETVVPLIKHPNSNVFGGYPILPKKTTQLMLDFWIQPPLCKEGESFKADVIAVDQFGNEHKIKNVEFKYR